MLYVQSIKRNPHSTKSPINGVFLLLPFEHDCSSFDKEM